MLEFTEIEITPINDYYKPEYVAGFDIVIAAADDMNVRKHIAETASPKLAVIDGRMAGTFFHVFSFQPSFELARYMKDWFPPEEASADVCTMRAIAYNTGAVGAVIAKICSDILKDEVYPYHIFMDMSAWILDV